MIDAFSVKCDLAGILSVSEAGYGPTHVSIGL